MWLNSAWGRAWARHVKTDGVSQSNINGKKLAAMPLPLPAITEQREIVMRATAALQAADRLTRAICVAEAALNSALRGALARAFRGELSARAQGEATTPEGRFLKVLGRARKRPRRTCERLARGTLPDSADEPSDPEPIFRGDPSGRHLGGRRLVEVHDWRRETAHAVNWIEGDGFGDLLERLPRQADRAQQGGDVSSVLALPSRR